MKLKKLESSPHQKFFSDSSVTWCSISEKSLSVFKIIETQNTFHYLTYSSITTAPFQSRDTNTMSIWLEWKMKIWKCTVKFISIIERFLKDTLVEMIKLLLWRMKLLIMKRKINKFGTISTESTWKSGQEDSLTESEQKINDFKDTLRSRNEEYEPISLLNFIF